MSDTLKERLNSHSNAFQGLLSLIPAKYYYDEDSKSQWKREKSKRSRAMKFDPEIGASALDEARRREITEDGQDSSSEQDVIYDDNGNEIKMNEGNAEHDDEKKIEEEDAIPANIPEKPERKVNSSAKKSAEPKDSSGVEPVNVPSEDKMSEPQHQENSKSSEKKNPNGIQELRKKLQDRVNELRARRKAPGSRAEGAPRSRDELIEARKQREEIRLKRKRDENPDTPATKTEENDATSEEQPPVVDSPEKHENLMFGKVKFGEKMLDEQKKPKKRQAADQLRVIEQRNAKIAQLDSKKQEEIAENAQWSSAILKSTGAKLKDNEKLLKKTVKSQQKKKQRSEREWKARLATVAHNKAAREAQRNANLEARKEQKGMKVKSKPKKRAGFEGKSRKKH